MFVDCNDFKTRNHQIYLLCTPYLCTISPLNFMNLSDRFSHNFEGVDRWFKRRLSKNAWSNVCPHSLLQNKNHTSECLNFHICVLKNKRIGVSCEYAHLYLVCSCTTYKVSWNSMQGFNRSCTNSSILYLINGQSSVIKRIKILGKFKK